VGHRVVLLRSRCTAYVPPKECARSPVGAIVLIGFGLLFLLANLGGSAFTGFHISGR